MFRTRTSKITALAYRQWRLVLSSPHNLLLPIFEPFLYLVIFASVMSTILPQVVYKGVPYSYLTFIVPGILSMAAFHRGVHAGTPIYVDRLTGELEAIFSLPLRRIYFLLANVCTVAVQGLLYSATLLVVSKTLSPDSPWAFQRALVAIGMASLLTISIAFVFSALCCIVRRQEAFNLLMNVIVLPLTLTSSAFYPLDHAPPWIRVIASINPINLAVDSIRQALLDPQISLLDIVRGAWPLIAIGVIAGALASYLFNRTLK